jgi:Zn-dependent protease
MDAHVMALFPLWYAAFLLSLTCHEAAHAWAAHRGGDDTAYLAGQVTLNPFPHVQREPFGTVLVPLVTYFANGWMMGWASAPYDPYWEGRHPRRAAAMSAAGPAANLLLAAIAFLALQAGLAAGVWSGASHQVVDQLVVAAQGAAPFLDGLGRFLSIVLSLNVILGVFNLIPVSPLDGISVLAGLVPPVRPLYLKARAFPVMGIVGILVAWKVAPWIIGPAWRMVVGLLRS